MIYKRGDRDYFVGSEFLTEGVNIVVYWDEISYADARELPLSNELKEYIALEVEKELEGEGLSVELFPSLHPLARV